jgi:hypothetical protein
VLSLVEEVLSEVELVLSSDELLVLWSDEELVLCSDVLC